jgi:Zn-dependent protease with chaperone function
MKNIMIAVLLAVSLEAWIIYMSKANALTVQDARTVYKKLCLVNTICPELYIVKNDDYLNAEASCDGVYIYTAMLKFLENNDQLALVLGHELGHIQNKDCKRFHTYTKEYHADQYGANLMTKAKFNRCKGVRHFKKFMRVFGDGTSLTHPMDSLRFNRINYNCKE